MMDFRDNQTGSVYIKILYKNAIQLPPFFYFDEIPNNLEGGGRRLLFTLCGLPWSENACSLPLLFELVVFVRFEADEFGSAGTANGGGLLIIVDIFP